MTPVPGTAYQSTISLFMGHLMNHIQFAGLGRVFTAPYDVELTPHNIVQPDIIVVLNVHKKIITPRRIVGVPNLLIEILSPGTTTHDRHKKYVIYTRFSVPEYWIEDSIGKTIEVFTHATISGNYRLLGVFAGETSVPSLVLPTLPVTVAQCFPTDIE
ncbi:MAG: Uma2 family endonuclease [Chloroflexaceae bacterium]|nr:Uma2 family endonuclease [Chloroflexaceae bacterium]